MGKMFIDGLRGPAQRHTDKILRHQCCRLFLFGSAMAIALGAAAPAWAHGTTERVSVGPGDVQSNDASFNPSSSADGRFIAFYSTATNLVPGDTNSLEDVFVCDQQTGITERVNLGPGGIQGDSRGDLDTFGYASSISADGRFVAFVSHATNLVPSDTNGSADVFVRDRQTDTTERVSLGPGGVQGNDSSYFPSISADGRFVAFESAATNLVPGDTNDWVDVFVRDRKTGTTKRVSVGQGGVQANAVSIEPSISANGRFVAFDSDATNLVPADTNGSTNVFVHDQQTGTTKRVSIGYEPSISADGRFVAFSSTATNLVPGDTNGRQDVFVRDRKTGTTERVSVGPGGVQGNKFVSYVPSISADGRFVAFASYATNLVPGDTNGHVDVFVRDRKMDMTKRVSIGSGGIQGNKSSYEPSISANGWFVAFVSDAKNLAPGDTNGAVDVFVRHLIP